jgi:ABC-type branched-subunit amino acid transport system permease subunit
VLSVWAILPLGIAALLWVMARRRVRAMIILAAVVAGWELVRWIAVAGGVDLTKYRMILYALALIVMMITRPQGIMGLRELWELRPARRTGGGGT